MGRVLRPIRLAVALVMAGVAVANATGPAAAVAARPHTLVVPAAYTTVQAAVDAASAGDRIVLLAGTYAEQVSIAKDLTVVGVGAAVLRAPRTLAVGALGQTSIIEVHGGASVNLSHVTVTGPGAGTCGEGALWAGIYAGDGATLTAEHIHVSNIRDAQLNDCFRSGNAIVVGDVDSPATATIRNSIIDGYQAAGVVTIGPASRATVTGNVINGPGRTPLTATGGIEFVVGATGTASHNVVTGNACGSPDLGCGPDWFNQYQVAGITADGPDTIIRDNLLLGNQVGIYTGPPAALSGNIMIGNDDFGLALQDGEFDVGPNVVVGGVGGVAVIASFDNATARVGRVKVVATSGPAVQEFECCGFTATALG